MTQQQQLPLDVVSATEAELKTAIEQSTVFTLMQKKMFTGLVETFFLMHNGQIAMPNMEMTAGQRDRIAEIERSNPPEFFQFSGLTANRYIEGYKHYQKNTPYNKLYNREDLGIEYFDSISTKAVHYNNRMYLCVPLYQVRTDLLAIKRADFSPELKYAMLNIYVSEVISDKTYRYLQLSVNQRAKVGLTATYCNGQNGFKLYEDTEYSFAEYVKKGKLIRGK